MENKNETISDIKKVVSGQDNDSILELTEVVPDEEALDTLQNNKNEDSNITRVRSVALENATKNINSVSDVKDLVQKLKNKNKKQTLCDVSMEDWIVKLLKPQLAAWIEKNLPSLVREIVACEIKKIIHDD